MKKKSRVLTVPMRNGNNIDKINWRGWIGMFLPYLWGMETVCSWRYRGWDAGSYRTYEEWKHEFYEHATKEDNGSYRTYEEWKLRSRKLTVSLSASSYRTYEEWKLQTPPLSPLSTFRSYRTYEEWKLKNALNIDKINWVLTVPMRNGN